MRHTRRRSSWIGVSIACGLLGVGWGSPAAAIPFQVDFTATTYQVVAGNSYADLLVQHNAGTPLASLTFDAFQNVNAQVHAGVGGDYSLLMTVVLNVAVTGQYEFQVGTDWGRGGAVAVIDNGTSSVISEFVTTDDIWWNNDWNDPDVISTTVPFTAGQSYTLAWVGFEGCCAGDTTVRFSFEGAPYQTFNQTNIASYTLIPEPRTGALVALGLVCLARRRTSRPPLA